MQQQLLLAEISVWKEQVGEKVVPRTDDRGGRIKVGTYLLVGMLPSLSPHIVIMVYPNVPSCLRVWLNFRKTWKQYRMRGEVLVKNCRGVWVGGVTG